MKYFCLFISIAILQLYGYAEQRKVCLGIKTKPLPAWAAEQLNLRYGEGLLVKHVLNNSPADKAGLYNHDIITKVDNQVVGTPENLRDLICDKQTLDKVNLSIIRQGNPLSIEVTLDHSAFTLAEKSNANEQSNESVSPHEPHLRKNQSQSNTINLGESQQQIRQQIQQQMQAFQNQISQLFSDDSHASFAELKKQMQQDFEKFKANKKQQGRFQSHHSSSFQFMDHEGVIKIKNHDNTQTIIIYDKDRNILYKGAYPKNQEEWDNMNANAKERLLELDLKIDPETGFVTAQIAS